MELNTSPAVRGASLQITTCAEDPAGPSPMMVTDLGSLGIPVGVALAVPAEAAAEGGAGTIFAAPEDIPAADKGSWDVADGGSRTMVSVSFLVLGSDSLEGALSHLDEELIGGSPFAWDGEVRGDVYIDDLVVMIVGEMCNGPPPEIVRRLQAADAAYGSHGMPVKRDKSEDPDFWGATLHGGCGRYGFNLERRASLAATTLFSLAFGVSGDELRRLLGIWSCLGFRREGVSVLGIAFQEINASPSADHALWTGVQRAHVACFSGHSSRRICAPTPPAIARADPSLSRRTRTVREGLVHALELLSVNTDKGASHSGRAFTRSPTKKVNTCVWTGRKPGQRWVVQPKTRPR